MTSNISLWQSPPGVRLIEAGELHLWRFRTDISRATAAIFCQTLAADERARAERLLSPFKQRQFVAGRYGLRHILAGYLKCAPATIAFDYGEQGKPSLRMDHARSLDFNLSHSGDWGLVAITPGFAVGVDLEQIVPKKSLQQLADYAFDDEEKRLFSTFSAARRQRGFYRLWTLKEARQKLPGVGLGAMKPGLSPCFQRFLFPAKGYLAAIATDFCVRRIVRYHQKLPPMDT